MEVLQALDDLGEVETSSGLAEAWVVIIHQVDVVPAPLREREIEVMSFCATHIGPNI